MSESFAVILAGGGAKGSYQIGAWKALLEMNIKIHAVCGASVGSLNAAMMAQQDFRAAERLWSEISLDQIIDLPPDLTRSEEAQSDKNISSWFNRENWDWTQKLIRQGGLDTAPLKSLIEKNVKEEYIRRSSVDLGLVTYNLSSMRPENLFIEDIPKGHLGDYLMASASFPLFKRTEIAGKRYTDGGISDNIPYRMAKSRGYRNILILDISGVGMNRRPNIEGTRTVYVQNSIEMGGVLDFSKDFLSEFQTLGYLDTLQTFDRLSGHRLFYTIEPRYYSKLAKRFWSPETAALFKREENTIPEDLLLAVKEILPKESRMLKDPLLAVLECAGLILKIPKIRSYTTRELIKAIRDEGKRCRAVVETTEEISYADAFKVLLSKRENNDEFYKDRSESPYLDYLAAQKFLRKERRVLAERALQRLYPSLLPARLFLSFLDHHPDL